MLSNIKLTNFKAFRNLDISLSNLNILTGVNGMGKSSLIQALLLLKQSDLSQGKLYLAPKNGLVNLGKARHIFHQGAGKGEDFTICIGEDGWYVDRFGTEKLGISEFNIKLSSESKDIQNENFLKIIKSNEGDFATYTNTQYYHWLEKVKFSDTRQIQFLDADRIAPKEFYGVDSDAIESRNLGTHGEYTAHFIARYQSEKVSVSTLIGKDTDSDALLSQIDYWLGQLTPGIHLKTYLNEDLGIARITYQFKVGNDDLTDEFTPVNVGFGFTYALPVITAILAAKKGDLLLIENPESHLHPRGQSKLGELLSRAAQGGIQLIVETHSDHVIHGIRIAARENSKDSDFGISHQNVNIYYFEKNWANHSTKTYSIRIDDKGKLYQLTPEGKSISLPKGFNDEWAMNMAKLF
jgi:predicted ATPase